MQEHLLAARGSQIFLASHRCTGRDREMGDVAALGGPEPLAALSGRYRVATSGGGMLR